ncbi:MAG TPA: kelch repeat-containing protein [Euzebyales bacterium]|nr:kelch repeat-containing protein [Euzebyales bacterium]
MNNRLAGVIASQDPGRFAEELNGLVARAREAPAPEEDRETLRQLLTSFETTAARFAAAEEAKERGDGRAVDAELGAADAQFQRTNEIATEYGMVPLETCDEHLRSASPSPRPTSTPSPPPTESATGETTENDVGGWRRMADARIARQQVATAEVNGLVYVAGGIRDQTGTRVVEALDPLVDEWRTVAELPVPLHHAMAVDYRGELVVLGGWQPKGNDLTAVVSDRVFALRSDRWVDLPPLNRPRAAGAAAVVNDQIVVVGGQAENALIPETEIYDGDADAWRDGADIETPREHLAAASDGEFLYAVGGRNVTSDSNSDALERYDPATDEWRTMEPMQTPRGSIDADIVDGRLVVVGGETPTAVLDTVEAYDLTANVWSTFPSLSTPRHGLGVAARGSSLYAVNGAGSPAHVNSLAAVETLAPPERLRHPSSWRDADDARVARQQVAVAEVNGVIWVAGGLEDEDVATAAVHGFDPAVEQWRMTEDLPQQLHHAMAVSYRNELVVIGGWVPDGANPTAQVSNKVFVMRSGAWHELATLQHARAAGAAAVIGDQIVVVGGQADKVLVTETEIYDGDLNTWRVGADIPTAREHLAASAHDGHVYAVGGRDFTPDRNSAALERYDPATDEWERLSPMPTPRGSIAAATVEGRLVVVGGETSEDVLDSVELYDFDAGTWVPGPPMPTPRHGTGAAAYGPVLYVIHGAEDTSHTNSSSKVEALDFE